MDIPRELRLNRPLGFFFMEVLRILPGNTIWNLVGGPISVQLGAHAPSLALPETAAPLAEELALPPLVSVILANYLRTSRADMASE